MPSAYAATFTVNSTTDAVDANPGNGNCATAGSVCTLRAAIQEANGLAGTDTITLPAGTYTLSIVGTGEDSSATGDLDITSDMTINGANETTTIIDAAGIDRVIDIPGTVTVTISNLTVKNGTTSIGGGINNSQSGSTLTLNYVTVSDNTGTQAGGGIDNEGTATLTNITVKNNTNNNGGGGGIDSDGTITISNSIIDSNISSNANGGGIWEAGMTATNVTISNNTAFNGGGIYNFTNSSSILTNVTISNNTASNQGGGIYNNDIVTLTNVTIANNTALAGANGGGLFLSSGTATLKNTLLSLNTTNNCDVTGGTLTSSGYNLSRDSSCSTYFNQTGDLNSTNPLLSSLADNGGSVQTMALQSGSPAIDAGTNTGCTSTDARGITRPQDGDNNGTLLCDIGAYEYVYPTPVPTPTPSSSSSSSSSSSGSNTPSCSSSLPNGIPNLFQINVTSTTAQLFFSPLGNPINFYTISYGLTNNSFLYGDIWNQGKSPGVLTRTINNLTPNTVYYFKLAGGNTCVIGGFSNTLKVKTQRKGVKTIKTFYEYTGKKK